MTKGLAVRALMATIALMPPLGDPLHTYAAERSAVDGNAFSDICAFNVMDYSRLKEELSKLFPIGSRAEIPRNTLIRQFSLISDAKEVFDPLQKRGVDISVLDSQRPNSKLYVFEKKCDENHVNVTKWSIAILAGKDDLIDLIEFRPLLDDDAEFRARSIPFNFDYFASDSAKQKALRDIVRVGMSKKEVLTMMDSLEEGFLGNFSQRAAPYKDNQLVYRYRSSNDKSVASRILGAWDFTTIIVLEFGSNETLVNLNVN